MLPTDNPWGGLYTNSLNDNLTESFRMTVKSRMMRDPTLFNQTDIPNGKFLGQRTTSCRVECKHQRCTHGWLQEKGMFSDLFSLSLRRRVKRRLWVREWYKKRWKYTHLNLLREISKTHAESDYKNFFVWAIFQWTSQKEKNHTWPEKIQWWEIVYR
jgi:hypothetical protein